MSKAEQKMEMGNRACQAQYFEDAVRFYGEAILLAGDAAPATYFSQRAIAKSALSDWTGARNDAEQAIQRPGGSIRKPSVNLDHKAISVERTRKFTPSGLSAIFAVRSEDLEGLLLKPGLFPCLSFLLPEKKA